MPILLALVHFLAIGGIAMILAAEFAVMRGELKAAQIRFLGRLDFFYMIFATLVLITGFSRALFGDKPWAYYAHTPFFHAKMGVFVLIGLISVVPTLRFMRWRKQLARGEITAVDEQTVQLASRWVLAQLVLLPLLPVFAVLMARGVAHLS